MESTGVYWKPVWHVLEGRFELKARRGPNRPNHFDRDKELQATRLIRRLKALGVEVTVKPAA